MDYRLTFILHFFLNSNSFFVKRLSNGLVSEINENIFWVCGNTEFLQVVPPWSRSRCGAAADERCAVASSGNRIILSCHEPAQNSTFFYTISSSFHGETEKVRNGTTGASSPTSRYDVEPKIDQKVDTLIPLITRLLNSGLPLSSRQIWIYQLFPLNKTPH